MTISYSALTDSITGSLMCILSVQTCPVSSLSMRSGSPGCLLHLISGVRTIILARTISRSVGFRLVRSSAFVMMDRVISCFLSVMKSSALPFGVSDMPRQPAASVSERAAHHTANLRILIRWPRCSA